MSIERDVQNFTKSAKPTDDARKEFRARLAKVGFRGTTIDRLSVQLPADLHGEWIHNDPVGIAEAQALGFELDKEYATKSKLHTNATGEAIVGDVVFMTMPKWMKEEIEIVKKVEYEKFHGVRKGTKPAEENQYATNISKETPLINDSKLNNGELTGLIDS